MSTQQKSHAGPTSMRTKRREARITERTRRRDRVPSVLKNVRPLIAKPCLKKCMIELTKGQDFTISFVVPRTNIPEVIQVIPSRGGGRSSSQQPREHRKCFVCTEIDVNGFFARVEVCSINVVERVGTCVVYVNCKVGNSSKEPGFNKWEGIYETFVRKNMARTWHKAVLKDTVGREQLDLGFSISIEAEERIYFAITK